MKERPILFSAPMVRALLAGTKTQTRRIVKPQPAAEADLGFLIPRPNAPGSCAHFHDVDERGVHSKELTVHCPYGVPGDRLWVRETFRVSKKHDAIAPRDLPFDRGLSVAYAAGGTLCRDEVGGPYISHPGDDLWAADWMGKTRVSIHMPRWASRIALEIVSVRVERLNEISEADAIAEGVRNSLHLPGGRFATENYAHLWWTLNGDGSWEANPWVWVVEFRRTEP